MSASTQLLRWRQAKGISQTAAANLVGVTQPTWSDWEAGKKCPHIKQAVRIEQETGVPVSAWLIRDAPDETGPHARIDVETKATGTDEG